MSVKQGQFHADPVSNPEVVSAFQLAVQAATTELNANPFASPTHTPTSATLGRTLINRQTRSIPPWVSIPLDQQATTIGVNAEGNAIPLWDLSVNVAGQGLAWFVAYYKVKLNTTHFSNLQDLKAQWKANPWRTDIELEKPQPVGRSILPPSEFWSRADIIKQVFTSGYEKVFGASEPPEFTPSNDSVYAAHFYTCGFATGASSVVLLDRGLMAQWANPQAKNLFALSCAANLISLVFDIVSIGIDVRGAITDTELKNDIYPVVEQALTEDALTNGMGLDLTLKTVNNIRHYRKL